MSRKALSGLAFVLVLLALPALAIAQYAGVFRTEVPVTLRVDRVGTQLAEKADVKLRGLVVGAVRGITTDGTGATVELGLDPATVGSIPANVTARLLPKTLFGEKYVALVAPPEPSAVALAAHATLRQDRSVAGIEVERVLDDLLPLLQAVEPQDLATTLGALSRALEGRGERLGATLEQLGTLTAGIRPALPDLTADVSELADFAEHLSDSAPDLLTALDDLTVTSRTLTDEAAALRGLYASVTGASDDVHAFLAANRENLIGLAGSSRPSLETLARYAPEYPCFFRQLSGLVPYFDQLYGEGTAEPGVHITLELVANRGKYVPNRDEPEYGDDRGPRCYPLVDPGPQYPPDGPFRDGSAAPPAPVGTPVGAPGRFGVADYGTAPASYDMGITNSRGEQQQVAELVAFRDGGDAAAVPGWGSVLVGPLYRGTEVRVA